MLILETSHIKLGVEMTLSFRDPKTDPSMFYLLYFSGTSAVLHQAKLSAASHHPHELRLVRLESTSTVPTHRGSSQR